MGFQEAFKALSDPTRRAILDLLKNGAKTAGGNLPNPGPSVPASPPTSPPWALSDPDVWNWTQRFGGRVLFPAGLISVLMGLFAPMQAYFAVFMASLFGGISLTCFMVWKWYENKNAS